MRAQCGPSQRDAGAFEGRCARGARTWRGRVILSVALSSMDSFHWETHPTVRATAKITVYLH